MKLVASTQWTRGILKGAKYAPDGSSTILTADDANHILLLHHAHHAQDQNTAHSFNTVLNASEPVRDYAWYPLMRRDTPLSCAFIAAARDQPLHLWDANAASLRASYAAHDHHDNLVSAASVCFEPTGHRIYSGYERAIRVFDVTRPGRECTLRPTSETRKDRGGQRGLISCLDFARDGSGLFAAGSFSGATGLYVENDHRLVALLGGHDGGITQVTFSADGLHLFTAARCDSSIHCWDIRKSVSVLHSFARAAPTNQRIGFDLSRCGRKLAAASQDGHVYIYSLEAPASSPEVMRFNEAPNAALWHPTLPQMAVVLGERRFEEAPGSEVVESCVSEGAIQVWSWG